MTHPDPAAWKYDLFVSYARGDFALVHPLVDALRAKGVRVWFDQLDILPGQRYGRAISEAIEASAALAICLGSAGGLTDWTEDELHGFRQRGDRLVIPVLLSSWPEGKALPTLLASRHSITLSPTDVDLSARRIARALGLAAVENLPHALNREEVSEPGSVEAAGDLSIRVANDLRETIGGGASRTVERTLELRLRGDRVTDVGGSSAESVRGNASHTVGGNLVTSVWQSQQTAVGLSSTLSVGATYVATVGGTYRLIAGHSVSVQSGVVMSFEAGESFEIRCGRVSIRISEDGMVSVRGVRLPIDFGEET